MYECTPLNTCLSTTMQIKVLIHFFLIIRCYSHINTYFHLFLYFYIQKFSKRVTVLASFVSNLIQARVTEAGISIKLRPPHRPCCKPVQPFLDWDWCGRGQLCVSGATLAQVVLNCIRERGEQAVRSRSVSTVLPWVLLQCQPWLPSETSVTWKLKMK